MFREETNQGGMEMEENLAFVHYMKCTEPMDKIGKVLEFVCLKKSTSNEVANSKLNESEGQMREVGEWFGM